MDNKRLVSVTFSIPKVHRDQLRRMIAERNLENPDDVISLSKLGREILGQYLEKFDFEAKAEISTK